MNQTAEIEILEAPAEPHAHRLSPCPDHPTVYDAGGRWPLAIRDTHTAHLWVQLGEDLEVEALSDLSPLRACTHEMGSYLEDGSVDDLIRPFLWSKYVDVEGHAFGCGAAQWALENGLMAGQPFEVEVYVRFYVSHGPEGDEGDCQTECEILRKAPVSPEAAADFWEAWFREFSSLIAIAKGEILQSRKAMSERADLLYVTTDSAWSHYDGMSPPNILRLSLRSSYVPVRKDGSRAYSAQTGFAAGESKNYSWPEAWAALRESVTKNCSQFAKVDLEKLPRPLYPLETLVLIES